MYISVFVCLIQIDKLPTGVSFTSELAVITVEEATRSAKTAELDGLGVTFDLGGSKQNQLATLAGDQTAISAWKKSPPVQLTEFMGRGNVPLGHDKVICWVLLCTAAVADI